MKRTIVAAGSCITEFVGRSIVELSSSSESFEFVHVRGCGDDREPISEALLGRAALVIEEMSPWVRALTDVEHQMLPADSAVIRLPTIHFNSLWPLMTVDPRNVPTPDLPFGMIPFNRGDALACNILQTETDPRRALQRYLETDLGEFINLKRHHEMEVAGLFNREQSCEVKIAAYVTVNFQTERLFLAHHHPDQALFVYLMKEVAAHPAVRDIQQVALTKVFAAIGPWTAKNHPPIFPFAAPIHPYVAEFFELSWWQPDMTYNWQGVDYTFEEWMRFYFEYASPLRPLELAKNGGVP